MVLQIIEAYQEAVVLVEVHDAFVGVDVHGDPIAFLSCVAQTQVGSIRGLSLVVVGPRIVVGIHTSIRMQQRVGGAQTEANISAVRVKHPLDPDGALVRANTEYLHVHQQSLQLSVVITFESDVARSASRSDQRQRRRTGNRLNLLR